MGNEFEESKFTKGKSRIVTTKRYHSNLHKPLLIIAVEINNPNFICYLINKGHDVNCIDDFGWTPLIAASALGFVDLISILCDNGAIINRRDEYGRTALH